MLLHVRSQMCLRRGQHGADTITFILGGTQTGANYSAYLIFTNSGTSVGAISGSADGAMHLSAGSTPTRVLSGRVVESTPTVTFPGMIVLEPIASAERPAPEDFPGRIVFVSDAPAGSKFQASDGTDWVPLG